MLRKFKTVRLTFAEAPSSKVLVTFGHHASNQTGAFFGLEFAAKYGIAAVGVGAMYNHWWNADDFDPLMEKILALAAGRPIITYGSSMGGYGALISSGALNAEAVIAASPQVSIGPLAPWEPRWASDLAGVQFRFGPTRELMSKTARVYLLWDNMHRPDHRQATEILDLPNVVPLPLPFAGHPVLGAMRESGTLSAAIRSMIDGTLTQESFAVHARRRRHSSAYHATLAAKVSQRRPKWQASITLITQAIDWPGISEDERDRWRRTKLQIEERRRRKAAQKPRPPKLPLWRRALISLRVRYLNWSTQNRP